MAIRSGELSPTEHVGDVLDRLAADPYNLVVTLDAERALAQAAALTEELAQGRWRGPLHGVALGVKDLFDVAGLPTRCGSALFADAAPAADAPRRSPGCAPRAPWSWRKLHTQEFAHGPTGDASASGPARNPHDPTRITGGSSSGSAGAVAAGYVPLALGTDTGCSVRTPAAHCGVVGLKPAFGHVRTAGVFPLAESLDHVGLLAADVHSAAVAWDVLDRARRHRRRHPGTGRRGCASRASRRRRTGAGRPGDRRRGRTRRSAALEQAGAQIVEVRTPMIAGAGHGLPGDRRRRGVRDAPAWLAERPDDYQPLVRDRLLAVADRPAHDYIDAQRPRRRLAPELRAAVGGVDVLLTATTRLRATPIGQAEVDGVQRARRAAGADLPFNLSGWPAVSVPVPRSDGGLPVGVQVVGVGLEERGMLRVAAAIEG